jgi:ubiquinone/menaquinone biosynthesis C-methylase UbiE
MEKDTLQELQRNWEGLAQTDPLWAICTHPDKKNQRWTREEFFATGQEEIAQVLRCVESLGLALDKRSAALDFGCGAGRLTRAMAEHFAECWGVDIAPTMIKRAQELNADLPRCRFVLNARPDLAALQAMLPSGMEFGFIYTSIVLQHIPIPLAAKYLREMMRVLMPGGVLVFQVLSAVKDSALRRLRRKLAIRTRIRTLLSGGLSYVMEMNCLAESDVRAIVAECEARVVDVRLTNSCNPAFSGRLKYLQEEPAKGFISKQYCVTKG